ncbi:MAG: TlyA family RNA methyltransferase [Candidatus Saccharimonadales bacterium]
MTKQRLDIELVKRKLTVSRSQSESWIKLGKVTVNGHVVVKPGYFVDPAADVKLMADEQYVSRAGLKLASVAGVFKLDFKDKTVLDIGSSTGGFTDYALRHGAKKVVAVDVGTDQLHPSLRGNKKIELHEKTDIRNVYAVAPAHLPSTTYHLLNDIPDIVVMDVSFISLREILPHVYNSLSGKNTQIVAMVKPQFEVHAEHGRSMNTERSRSTDKTNPSTSSGFRGSRTVENVLNKGVIKNDSMRRQILKDFEEWSHNYFVIRNKRDSDVAGANGNQERFYLLTSMKNK